MFKRKERLITSTDMTMGNPYKLIFLFSIPLLIGNVFQQLYNMVDSIVVGNYVGEKALAAVGTGFPIIFMLSSLFIGIGMGATIMVSQYYGAKDMKQIQDTIGTMYTALLIGVVPLTFLGIVLSKPLLQLINVPDDGTLKMATQYMIIIFIGMIFNLGFNINASILQGLGDSKTSLLFLLVACIVNIVLDIVFTVFWGWGVIGVAIATIIAQLCSWVFGIYFINKHYDFIQINPFKFYFRKDLFLQAMKLGIPAGIQQALFSIGSMFMLSLVNSYGFEFMAGFSGANKIDTFAFMPIQSFSIAVTTYVGQNIGANQINRVKLGMRASLVLSIGTSIGIGAIIYPLSGILMRMFGNNPKMIDAGVSYLHQLLPFYSLLAILFIYNSVLRGAGESIIPMISSVVSLWALRIPTAYLLAHFLGSDYIYFSYVIGWAAGIIVSLIYYKTGKWKKKSIIKNRGISVELQKNTEVQKTPNEITE
ncbi:MATE family efflux transporter [Paludicola sp. MB14-C6]|uniref:MATE family efflux transporter n=1 Tax=Paludihabitans sp. MB14-C6 TaxID=3070656 RepID=UPI0027DCAD28|nr:MATE family efflux transporter [Paludicola sp. MB14-C6]WMJ22179.1 MATE family efflux transporter [Paludicola sp. MB14-C6]